MTDPFLDKELVKIIIIGIFTLLSGSGITLWLKQRKEEKLRESANIDTYFATAQDMGKDIMDRLKQIADESNDKAERAMKIAEEIKLENIEMERKIMHLEIKEKECDKLRIKYETLQARFNNLQQRFNEYVGKFKIE